MKAPTLFSIAALLSATVFACSAAPVGEDESLGDDADESEEALSSSSNYTYYRVTRQDLRRCMFPMCGGVYVARLNRATTKCADGSYQKECYVAELDLSGLGLVVSQTDKLRGEATQGDLIMRGKVERKDYSGIQSSVLVASEGWTPANPDAKVSGTFYKVSDNGIRCIKAPCPSLDEGKLNYNTVRKLTGLDLTNASLSDKQDEVVMEDVATGLGVLVAGYNRSKSGGVELSARAVYLKVRPTTEGACWVNEDCVLTTYTKSVASENDCYCRMCGGATDSATAERNADSYTKFCSDFSRPCPMPMCLPMMAACVEGQCVAQRDMPQ